MGELAEQHFNSGQDRYIIHFRGQSLRFQRCRDTILDSE